MFKNMTILGPHFSKQCAVPDPWLKISLLLNKSHPQLSTENK